MNNFSFYKTAFGGALIVMGMAAGISVGVVSPALANEATPQAHSDGLGAAIADTAITAKVKAKYGAEEALKKSDVNVTTTNGVVTLEGLASDGDAKTLAESLAKTVEGVKSVDNNLKTPSSSENTAKTKEAVANTERVAADSWITTKVKSDILADSVSKGFEVQVKTTHGVVVLEGMLANQDAIDHVKDIAAKIKGVKSVDVTNLTVKK